MNPATLLDHRALGVLSVMLLSTSPIHAEDDQGLLGGWEERRSMSQAGVEFDLSYQAGIWSNVSGGAERGTDYEGFAPWSVTFDWEKLLRWKGGGAFVSGYTYHGGAPSERVGLFAARTISGSEAAPSLRWFEVYLSQSLARGSVQLEIGQLAADDDFYQADAAADFLNGTFGYFGLGRDLQAAPMYPFAAPGVYLRTESWEGVLETHWGIYSASLPPDATGETGTPQSFDDGHFALAELRLHAHRGAVRGSYAVGAMETASPQRPLAAERGFGANWGGYAIVDQRILEATDGHPGLSAFARAAAFAPRDESFITSTTDFGVRIDRPFPKRSGDVFAVGYSTARFSEPYARVIRESGGAGPRAETILEVTYLAPLTPWFSLQADLQAIFTPLQSGRDALVLGLRTTTTL